MDSIEPMMTRRPVPAAVILVAVALLGACTSDEPEPPGPNLPTSTSVDGGEAAGATGGEDTNPSLPGSAQEEEGVAGPREDRDSTSSGEVPAYAEMLEARITGSTQTFVLDARFKRTLPERMPDEYTTMRVTFTLITTSGKRYSFIAQGSPRGWLAFTQGTSGDEQFPGSLHVVGARLQMELPWSVIGAPNRFQWLANAAWDSSAPDGHRYSFDVFPNGGLADYP